jgi:hypothetical protein
VDSVEVDLRAEAALGDEFRGGPAETGRADWALMLGSIVAITFTHQASAFISLVFVGSAVSAQVLVGRVERADGRTITPYELSQGTYDLLYLVVRLKLARRFLEDQTGFLVLDDAFVHSDSERTAREIKVLGRLVDIGWQINYFSFRNAVRDTIGDSKHSNVIELDQLGLDI